MMPPHESSSLLLPLPFPPTRPGLRGRGRRLRLCNVLRKSALKAPRPSGWTRRRARRARPSDRAQAPRNGRKRGNVPRR
eukprot:2298954-Alexandrium_andersonii.AAC.1